MRAYERLLNYVKVYTTSDEQSGTTPSSQRQFDLGNQLVQELKSLGVQNVRIDETCYVYGEIPATPGMEKIPAIGFIAHMDTSPAVTDTNVKPRIVEHYDGKDIVMNGKEGLLVMKEAIELFNQIVVAAIPYGLAFALGQMVINTFMNMAFGGKIKFN